MRCNRPTLSWHPYTCIYTSFKLTFRHYQKNWISALYPAGKTADGISESWSRSFVLAYSNSDVLGWVDASQLCLLVQPVIDDVILCISVGSCVCVRLKLAFCRLPLESNRDATSIPCKIRYTCVTLECVHLNIWALPIVSWVPRSPLISRLLVTVSALNENDP